jgi:energy-coupling factor transporter ATP-binding protein EcfA2
VAPDAPPLLAVEEQRWLKKAVEHYHRRLLYTPAAQQYLVDRGINITEVISVFELGYVDGTLLEKLPPEGIEALKRIGVLTEGQELMRGCIAFPLVDSSGRVVSLYGRHTQRRLHLYLTGPHRGIFNPHGARSHEEVILTESIIDATALWAVGLHNVLPAYGVNGLTEEILDHLAECRVRKVVLMLDSDEAGRAAGAAFAAQLAERHITSRVVELPAKDPADFFAHRGTVEQVRALLAEGPETAVPAASFTMPAASPPAAAPSAPLSLGAQPSGLLAPQALPLAFDSAQESAASIGSQEAPEPDGSGGKASTAPDGTAEAEPCEPGDSDLAPGAPVEQAATSEDPSPEREPVLESTPDGVLTFTTTNREYRIRGLTATGLDRLRVNLRLRVNGSFHLDTLDLYQARARSAFAQAASKQCGLSEAQIGTDLLELIERLEAARLRMSPAGSSSKAPETPMTAQEREATLAYLKAPNLLERIVDDFRACGLIGERSSVLVSYLAAISRKLAKPLSLLIVARTGAGKSSLQDALCSLVPPEEVVRVTRLTGQALFYKDPDSLKHKLLAIAEEEGASQAAYSLRTLASDQWLSIAATRTDPQTGKLHTEHYEIHGPVTIVITTTSPEAFDEETRSRFVLLTLNESVEQTRAILARQRQSDTLEGVLAEANAEYIQRRHHHLQRLLRPLKVVNPYSKELDYPDEKLIARREQKKYLTLIKSLALLHQYQREIKRAATPPGARNASEGMEVEYVEVTPDDIRLANELAREVLWQSWDELAPPVRGLKQELEKLYQRRAQELKIAAADVQLTRRQIREATGWSDWQVRVYCQRLVEMEYLIMVASGNGRPCLYQLVEPGRDDRPQLDSLAEVKQ